MKFKQPKIILLGLFSLLLLYSFGGGANKEFDLLKEKYNCENVDDCLDNYEFEGARAFSSKISELGLDVNGEELISSVKEIDRKEKIYRSESTYLASNGEYLKAIEVIDEGTYYSNNGYGDLDHSKHKFSVYKKAVDEFIEKNMFKEAKKWALMASSQRSPEGCTKTGQNFTGCPDTEDWISQQDFLLDYIEKYEKIIA